TSLSFHYDGHHLYLRSFPTRRSSDLNAEPHTAALTAASVSLGYELEVRGGRRCELEIVRIETAAEFHPEHSWVRDGARTAAILRSEEHTSELQSRENLVCRLLLEKKK